MTRTYHEPAASSGRLSRGRTIASFVLVIVCVASSVALFSSAGSPGASAQQEPPPTPWSGISDTIHAAKLTGLASGDVLAGPGQVLLPAGDFPDDPKDSGFRVLWEHDTGEDLDPSGGSTLATRNVTLTVQGLTGCELFFRLVRRRTRASSPFEIVTKRIGPFHESVGLTGQGVRRIDWSRHTGYSGVDCGFLWVVRNS